MSSITGTDWLAIAGGIAAIAWVNWYFFLAERSRRRSEATEPRRTTRG